MSGPHNDEFYVGYLDQAPDGIAARSRTAILLALGIAVGLAVVLVVSQSRFTPAVFEYGIVRSFEGVLLERPQPLLLVARPGADDSWSTLQLAGAGKSGVESQVGGLDGKRVKLNGSLVYRGGRTLLKLEPGEVEVLGDVAGSPVSLSRIDLGDHDLVGEIVDAQCWMGVMKPGHSKPHRACAVRCIEGGSPAVLLVRHRDGSAETYLLVSREGETLRDEVTDVVAEPVTVHGRVERQGDLLVLFASRSDIQRLP